jgi:hypothetical protein
MSVGYIDFKWHPEENLWRIFFASYLMAHFDEGSWLSSQFVTV